MQNFWLAFITGLTTGGISCLAVQGGLLTSSITTQKESEKIESGNWQYVAMFLGAKLIAYTILGGFLGYLGSFLILSVRSQAILQLLIGIFLLGTAARLLNLHPIFRYFVIQPPKFVYKLARKESKSSSFIAPGLLGISTVLMPCGVTQAMMMTAVSTGNTVSGALIMFFFILGTSPIFFTLGVAAIQMMKKKVFSY